MTKTPEELKREFVRKWGWEFTPKNIGEGEEYEWHPHKCLTDLNALLDKLMPTEEVNELEEYVRLLKIDADKMPNKHDLYHRGEQVAYSHCWFTFNRMVEKFRSRMKA